MGRRKRNTRSIQRPGVTFESVEELKAAQNGFDLSDVNWIRKKVYKRISKNSKDVLVTVGGEDTRDGFYVRLSFAPNAMELLSDFLLIGRAKDGTTGVERLYIVKSNEKEGYKATSNAGTVRRYARFPLEKGDLPSFIAYEGEHDLKYDNKNDLYFITKGE